jgi:hypothetical protein
MSKLDRKLAFAAIATFGIACIALLWSWNSLAELVGGPTAEFRHVLSALIILAGVRALLTNCRGRKQRWHG